MPAEPKSTSSGWATTTRARLIDLSCLPKPVVPYSTSTQSCIVKRFRAVHIKEFGGADRVVPFVITL